MDTAQLSFLPWVRQGAAGAISTTDSLDAKIAPIASVAPTLALNGEAITGLNFGLRGPADVIGLDANQMVRTDPHAATSDFEPNCFPSIEFDRPDFPWLFTPARANQDGKLRPWLCLIVLRQQEGITLDASAAGPLPRLSIAAPATPLAELPDLKDSWAWAHAQVAALGEDAVRTALGGAPELSLSRLLCARRLAPNTEYLACLVPTFDLGRKAGLGLPIAGSELAPTSPLLPAWVLDPKAPPAAVLLPVYYHWSFRTGQQGDFEALARRLRPATPAGLGTRTIDISAPGFDAGGATTQPLEGALLPIRAASAPLLPDVTAPQPFKTTLVQLLNEPSRAVARDPASDPVVAPPLYGRWHAGRNSVATAGEQWLDELNLDPRWRIPAAFGTRVIQEHQEALMASAWQQAAQLAAVNQRRRQMQLSLAVGESLHRRHFSKLNEESVLRIAAPAFGRLRLSDNTSMLADQAQSFLQTGATRAAMRRIGRQRGPLSRRTAAKGAPRSSFYTWVARMNGMVEDEANPPPPPPAPAEPPAPQISYLPDIETVRPRVSDSQSFFGVLFVQPDRAAVAFPGTPVRNTTRTEVPDYFRGAARAHFARIFPPPTNPHFHHRHRFARALRPVLEQIDPRVTISALAQALATPGPRALAPVAHGQTALGVEAVLAAPYFPHAMVEPLREIAQDLLLPGIDKVAPDSVVGLRTNLRFIESYLVGLNHEMGRELLWRGYPTDQRGTYFDRFWGQGTPNTAPADITSLHTWGTRSLGAVLGRQADFNRFVMLMRSSLLRRYPNAAIYLTPALSSSGVLKPDELPAHERMPIFSGALPPDIAYFGFDISTAAATGSDGTNGYYIVIQEHPTEPRFGLDDDFSWPTGATHLSLALAADQRPPLNGRAWGKNSAEMAAITRRLPVRIAIHAARLVAAA